MMAKWLSKLEISGFALMALVIAAVLVVGCSSSAAQSAPNNGSSEGRVKAGANGLKRSSQGGNVTIDITWENPSEAGNSSVRFDVAMNTHSVDLDGYDLGELAVLRNDQGVEAMPDKWDAPLGGHHRKGELVFSKGKNGQPIIGPGTKAIELLIRDVGGVKERSFRWDVAR